MQEPITLPAKLREIHSALDYALGDSDPTGRPEPVDRDAEPVLWAAQQLAQVIAGLPPATEKSKATSVRRYLTDGVHPVEMPKGAQILTAARLRTGFILWASVDQDAATVMRSVRSIETGEDVPDGAKWVETVHESPDIWHIFDLGEA